MTVSFSFENGLYLIKGLLAILLLTGCSSKPEAVEPVIAVVGDRSITLRDFQERSELAVRPPFCGSDRPEDKGIILNSLIGEKLLALEAAGDESLVNDANVANYLSGLKEQKMRSILLQRELKEAVQISAEEKLAVLNQARKKIHVGYLFSQSKEEIDQWKSDINSEADFDRLEKQVNAGKPAHLKEVIWGENLLSIESALFTDSVTVGSVAGPIATPAGYYLMKVIDIRREVILGQGSLDAKLRKVEAVLFERKWHDATANFVYEIMKDKKIELDARGFDLLLAYARPLYALPNTREEYLTLDKSELARLQRDAKKELTGNLELPLLTIDGDPWSLGKFIDYTQRRPMIFKAKRMREREFPHYLKLAVKEIIRDKYLTDMAYDQQLDQDPETILEASRWQDHMFAIRKRNQMLQDLGFEGKISENYLDAIRLLRPHLNTLARKYKIEINETNYRAAPLTGVPWMAVRKGLPYQAVVPSFPVITNDERLNYLTYFSELGMPAVNSTN